MAQTLENHLNEISRLLCQLNDKQKLRLVGDELVVGDRDANSGMVGTSLESRKAVEAVLVLYKLGMANGLAHIEILDALRSHEVCRAILLSNPKLLAEVDQLEQEYITSISQVYSTLSAEHISQVNLYELANVKGYDNSPSIKACANYFDKLSYLFQREVILQPNLHMRTLSYKRWLCIATELFEEGDFLSLASLYAGINSAAFARLKATQAGVDVAELNDFLTQLAQLTQQADTYGNMRQGMAKAFDDGAVIVPHISVMQNLLTLNNEGINPALERLSAASQRLNEFERTLWSFGQNAQISAMTETLIQSMTILDKAISDYKACQAMLNQSPSSAEHASLSTQELNERAKQNQAKMQAAAQELQYVGKQLMSLEHKLVMMVSDKDIVQGFSKLNKSIQADISRASQKMLQSNDSLAQFSAYKARLSEHLQQHKPAGSVASATLLNSTRAHLNQSTIEDKLLFTASLNHEPRNVFTAASTILTKLAWQPGSRLKSLVARFKHFVLQLPRKETASVEQHLQAYAELPVAQAQLDEQVIKQGLQELAADRAIGNETQLLDALFGKKQHLLDNQHGMSDDELELLSLPAYVKASDLQNIVLNTRQGLVYVCCHSPALSLLEKQEREPGAMLSTLLSQASTRQELGHISAKEFIVISEILTARLKALTPERELAQQNTAEHSETLSAREQVASKINERR